MRKVIHAFKFQRKISLAKRLGRTLAFVLLQDERFRGAACIVPVPLHVSRLRERGYNQSVLLAEAMCGELSRRFLKNALVRRKRTKAQTTLTTQRRKQNVAKAFTVEDPSGVVGRKIVLVDDVLTTGATADACARALREAGASDVVVATVTRASWGIVFKEKIISLIVLSKLLFYKSVQYWATKERGSADSSFFSFFEEHDEEGRS
jgi:competence protein ComFC